MKRCQHVFHLRIFDNLKSSIEKFLIRYGHSHFMLIAIYPVYAFILFLDSQNLPNFFDENSFLMNVLQFGVKQTLVPYFTNYPTFYSYIIAAPIYLVYGIYFFCRKFPIEGLTDPLLFALIFQGDLDIWLWVGRTISILFAVLIMHLVISHNRLKNQTGPVFFSTLILFCDPYGVYMTHARYALPDIMVVLFITSMMLILYRYLKDHRTKHLYLASILAGLATSAKFNAFLAIVPVLLAPLLVLPNKKIHYQAIFFSLFIFIFAFFFGSPALLFSSHSYAESFQFEANILYNTADSISRVWLLKFLWQTNAFVCILLLLTILFTIWRHNKEDVLFHALLIPSVIFLTGLDKKTTTYLLFLYPILIIKITEFLSAVMQFSKKKYLSILISAVLLAGGCQLVAHLYSRLAQNSKIDNRTLAREWVYQHVPAGSSVLLDWGYVPILSFRDLGVIKPNIYLKKNPYPVIVKQYLQTYQYRSIKLLELNYNLTLPLSQKANLLITSNWCYEQYLAPIPELPNIVVSKGDLFRYYLLRRNFYLKLLKNELAFRLIKTFKEGSGPSVLIFQRIE